MGLPNPPLSGYRLMWQFVMFDLPVQTKPQRHAATAFRKWLLDQGYEMSQFSVYIRLCVGKEQAARRTRDIRRAAPVTGTVQVLLVTDTQFAQMVTLSKGRRRNSSGSLSQLALF